MQNLTSKTWGWRKALHLLLCVALLAWTLAPAVDHAPRVVETLQEHAEMVAEHGHSHGLEEDLWWAFHGHGHDVVDHDHNSVVVLRDNSYGPAVRKQAQFIGVLLDATSSTRRPLERPPRG